MRKDGPDGALAVPRDPAGFLWSLLAVLVVGLWLPPIASSFRLDETATAWITREGLGTAWARALEYQGESPLYFVLVWGVRALFGASEIVMRLPSLLAMAGAVLLLIRLGRNVFDSETGLLAGVVFASSPGIVFAAVDARPYAFAILALIASAVSLMRYRRLGRASDALAAVATAALAVAFHYLAGLVLVAHAVLAWKIAKERHLSAAKLAGGFALFGALVLPLVPHLMSLWRRRGQLTLPSDVSLTEYLAVIAPPAIVGVLLIAWTLARSAPDVSSWAKREPFVVVWWLALPSVLFVVSVLGSTTVFEPRFFFFAVPGLALVVAGLARTIAPDRARMIAVSAIALVAVAASATSTHSGEDWRGAAAFLSAHTDEQSPILLRPAYIESADPRWVSDPGRHDYLLSPLSIYPVPGDPRLLPYDPGTSPGYLEALAGDAFSADRFFLVTREPSAFVTWFKARAEAEEFRSAVLWRRGLLFIVGFTRSEAPL